MKLLYFLAGVCFLFIGSFLITAHMYGPAVMAIPLGIKFWVDGWIEQAKDK